MIDRSPIYRIALAAILALTPGALAAETWPTPAEAADFESTPSLDETLAFLREIARRLPEARVGDFGRSATGRPLPLVVVDRDRAFDPVAARAAGRPILLIQSGIHAGEIDGKDATLMLLRDLALGRRRELLDAAVLLFAPIYNADGHERVSPFNRPNQNGPIAGMGFRATADGHDLNRDWLKVETPEARAMLGLVEAWNPDLHVDVHVTNGVDHEWVLTWLRSEPEQLAAPLEAWLGASFPRVLAATERAGHRTGPYVELLESGRPEAGFATRLAEPRYSTAYFALRHRPSILVETHAHHAYRERVLATRDFLAALVTEVGASGAALRAAIAAAEEATIAAGRSEAPPSSVAIRFAAPAADRILLPLRDWRSVRSMVSGEAEVRYVEGSSRPTEVPWVHGHRVELALPRPRGYFVLPGWPVIEERIAAHGLRCEPLGAPKRVEVEVARLSEPRYAPAPWQGRTRVEARVERRLETRELPAGTLWIPADQPRFEVAVQLFEPEAPDSLLAWGFLSSIFERKEYIGRARLEQEAARLLGDPGVAEAWARALEDPDFAADRSARYAWWYERTPYHDETLGLLPIFRARPARPRRRGGRGRPSAGRSASARADRRRGLGRDDA
jgi:hypothetical protein